MQEILLELGIIMGKIVFLIFVPFLMVGVPIMTYLERRISAFIQDRLGPNRVGPQGLLQAAADGVKFFLKEDIIPAHVNKIPFVLAPMISIIPALVIAAIIPWGTYVEILGRPISLVVADLDVGILFVFAISSLGVYGIVMGGWASNSKYPLLGAIRATAQMISYELALGLSVVGVFMITQDLNLTQVVQHQIQYGWNILWQPLGFLIFLVAIFAETNRHPFDLPEAETELVAGYHTEYSSMKFSMFFMAEYTAMIVLSAITTTLFLGGWHIPFVTSSLTEGTILYALVCVAAVGGKTFLFLFLFMWVRWTLPRFRYDQLMHLGWKVFLPLSLANVFATGIVLAAIPSIKEMFA